MLLLLSFLCFELSHFHDVLVNFMLYYVGFVVFHNFYRSFFLCYYQCVEKLFF